MHNQLQHSKQPDDDPPKNHKSAIEFAGALERSISAGQAGGTYLVIEADVARRWRELRYSPFGCVPKQGVAATDARLIHDLSWPRTASVNEHSTQEQIPQLEFEPVRRLAARIEDLRSSNPAGVVKIMKGGVKGAYRHIPVSARLAANFAGKTSEGKTVIDLALPFEWTGSPGNYGVFGGAIAFLVAREIPRTMCPHEEDTKQFFSYVWVDDHVLIEQCRGRRLELAATALRLGMMAVLGPEAINDDKFSSWESRLCALGLEWDVEARTVSMPADKITKAISRIDAVLAGAVSRLQLAQLLGSLRHVGICCRPARAFLQRLQEWWKNARPYRAAKVPTGIWLDLQWMKTLLQNGHLNKVPTSIIAGTLAPSVHLYMDASNEGLCVINPESREYMRVRFDSEERQEVESGASTFSINVRESLGVLFAAIVWGPRWAVDNGQDTTHVRCWIDNATAVAWCGSHHSSNSTGQEIVRALSCAELVFGIHISTAHIPGASNGMADLGSRAWSGSKLRRWTNTVSSWVEQDVDRQYRKIHKSASVNSNGVASQTLPGGSTSRHGSSGAPSAQSTRSPASYPRTTTSISRYNSLCSQLRASIPQQQHSRAEPSTSGPSSATLDGATLSAPDSDRNCSRTTSSYSTESSVSALRGQSERQSPSTCWHPSSPERDWKTPSIALFVGLRCWASSFVSEVVSFSRPTGSATDTAWRYKTSKSSTRVAQTHTSSRRR